MEKLITKCQRDSIRISKISHRFAHYDYFPFRFIRNYLKRLLILNWNGFELDHEREGDNGEISSRVES